MSIRNPMTAAVVVLASLFSSAVRGQEEMTPELLWRLGRLGGGAVSPDGQHVVYSVRRYRLAENSGDSDLHLVPLAGGKARRITNGPASESAVQWVATAKGTRLFFQSRRGEGASSQAWSLNPESGDLSQITAVEGGIANLVVAPSGDRIAYTIRVKLDPTVADIYPDLPMADARIIDSLMYRHWDSWSDYRYSHLCVARLGADGKAEAGVDLMTGMKVDCPVPPFAGSEQFRFSPDGREIAFTMKIAGNWAESTDSDVYLRPSDGSGRSVCITTGMNGYDNDPAYSPDGRRLLFHSMQRPGFESDRNRIMVFDRGEGSISEITTGLDQMAHAATFAPDSKSIYFVSERRGTNQVYKIDLATAQCKQVTEGRFNWDLRDIAPDGKTLLLARQSMQRPWELVARPTDGGAVKALTDVNGAIFDDLRMPSIKERWVRASDGKRIHNWVILPPDFDPKKKYPMLTYCQGGPQGQIGQWFSYRWNFHLMAAQGYVVLAVNRRGLPGFGRDWNDEISKDWGGQAMQDILSSTDDMLTEPWVDASRVAAIGASFGGYTAYWMMGNAEDRFCSMISHAGLFNLDSFYGATEELFFANWDIGGPYWESPELRAAYDKFSPHRFVGNWRTPLLVIHGEKDFRVPINQGMEAFTAAQVKGIPSRFLYYPQEGHWITSPQNGVLWHRVFFDWLERTCAGTAAGD